MTYVRVAAMTGAYAGALAVLLGAVVDLPAPSPVDLLRDAVDKGLSVTSVVRSHPRETRRWMEGRMEDGLRALAAGREGDARRLFDGADRIARNLEEVWEDPAWSEAVRHARTLDRQSATKYLDAVWLTKRADRLAGERRSLDEARSLAQRAEASFSELGAQGGRLRALHALATVENLKRSHAAVESYERLAREAKSARDHYRYAAALNNLSAYAEAEGRYRDALEGYRETLSIAERHGYPRIEGFALLYIGNLYHRLGLPERAHSWLARAEAIFRELGESRLEAIAASNRGASLHLMGEPDGALEAYQHALTAAARRGERARPSTTRLNVAELLLEAGRGEEALPILEELVERAGDEGPEAHVKWGALVTLARVHLASGNLELAEERAIDAETVSAALHTKLVDVETTVVRAEVDLAKGDDAAAARRLARAVAAIEALRGEPEHEEERTRFLEAQSDVYRNLASVELRRGAEPSAIFELLERFRARAFLDSLEGGAVVAPTLSGAPGLELAAAAKVTTLSQVQEVLRSNEVLLHLSLLPDRLVLMVIPPEGAVELHRVPADPVRLSRLAMELQTGWSVPSGTAGGAARELFRFVLAPVTDALAARERLVLVPDGPLFAVPWPAASFRGRMLVESHDLIVAPSASAFVRLRERSVAPSGDTILVVSNPTSERARDLPEAEREGREVASLFPRSKLLLGADASESNVKGALGDYGTVHFGTHARVEPGVPLASSLLLAGGTTDAEASVLAPFDEHDGILTGYEILGTSLRPGALVTLAACESLGRGPRRSEGVIGLARAFFEAGATTVVAAHWPVEDRPTRELMVRFYERLSRGGSRAAAFSEAQRRMARGEAGDRFRHPYYWAGFVLLGAS